MGMNASARNRALLAVVASLAGCTRDQPRHVDSAARRPPVTRAASVATPTDPLAMLVCDSVAASAAALPFPTVPRADPSVGPVNVDARQELPDEHLAATSACRVLTVSDSGAAPVGSDSAGVPPRANP